MWSFLYQVLASAAAALLKQFELQTGQLSSPGTTCTLTQCSQLYVLNVSEYSAFYFVLVSERNINCIRLCMMKAGRIKQQTALLVCHNLQEMCHH